MRGCEGELRRMLPGVGMRRYERGMCLAGAAGMLLTMHVCSRASMHTGKHAHRFTITQAYTHTR